MLKITRMIKKGFSLKLDETIVHIMFDSFNTETGASICIDAPKNVEICRDELGYDDIKKGNFSASKSGNAPINKQGLRPRRKEEVFNKRS